MAALNDRWRTASASANGASCVEVRLVDGQIQVRDTKLGPDSPVLSFRPDEWTAFQSGMRDGEFDIA